MFALALLAPRRGRAIWSVFSFFPVSVLAFLVMALHYGLALGGPFVFLQELGSVFAAEASRVESVGSRALRASVELFVTYGNWPLIALALLGGMLALCSRHGSWRAIARLGLVLIVPGVCNQSVLFHPALAHAFCRCRGLPVSLRSAPSCRLPAPNCARRPWP